MAWQFVYTSAAKLLEAGRTGFGTVARHRSVNGLLATSVERLSQFARLPGHDPKRVVYCHRIINVGGSDYHVLSCLRDAGSDYTGRTNHIAHHLVAESGEIERLIEAGTGITPGDVLRAMSWRSEWTESARYFDTTEEIDLEALKSSKGEAWRSLSGNAEHARLPWADTAQRGCYFVTPPELDLLPLISESLDEEIAQAWQTTFTTNLEPNDDVADFKWIGLPGASPLRSMAEASARPIFDLSSPATLPPPPARPVALVKPPPPLVEILPKPAVEAFDGRPDPLSGDNKNANEQNKRPEVSNGGISPANTAASGQGPKPILTKLRVAAILLVLLSVGGAIIYINPDLGSFFTNQKNTATAASKDKDDNEEQEKKKKDNEYEENVNTIFNGWNIPEIKKAVISWNTQTRVKDLKTIESLLKSLENYQDNKPPVSFERVSEDISKLLLENSIDNSSIETPSYKIDGEKWFKAVVEGSMQFNYDSESILKQIAGFEKDSSRAKKKELGELVNKQYTNLNGGWEKWNELEKELPKQPFRDSSKPLPYPKTHTENVDKLYSAAMQILLNVKDLGTIEPDLLGWKILMKNLSAKVVNKQNNAGGIDEWIGCADDPASLASLQLPKEPCAWLQNLVARAEMENLYDADDAKHPISFLFMAAPAEKLDGNTSGDKIKIELAGISSQMQLRIWNPSEKSDKYYDWTFSDEEQSNNTFRIKRAAASNKDVIEFRDGCIVAYPASFEESGGRIVGFSKDYKILFELRLVKHDFKGLIFGDSVECVLQADTSISNGKDAKSLLKPYTLRVKKKTAANILQRISAGLKPYSSGQKQNGNLMLNGLPIEIKEEGIVVGKNIIDYIKQIDIEALQDALETEKNKPEDNSKDSNRSRSTSSKESKINKAKKDIEDAKADLISRTNEFNNAKPYGEKVIEYKTKNHSISIIKVSISSQPEKK